MWLHVCMTVLYQVNTITHYNTSLAFVLLLQGYKLSFLNKARYNVFIWLHCITDYRNSIIIASLITETA